MSPSPYLNGLGLSQPSTPVSPPLTAQDAEVATMSRRFEQYALYDQEKTKFMAELLARYEFLHQQHQILASERIRDRNWIQQWQAEKLHYDKWIKKMQRITSENPFVMVLIDGDGMIFLDEFIRDGEAGGRRAASQLYAAVQAYIDSMPNHLPHDARIVCRIYANVRGLAEVLVRTGVLHDVAQLDDFARGFTRGKTLFDFIDVGAGKDRADEKIIESFKLFSRDYHCRRLLFGCSHDNGYARSLEEYSDKAELISKVVLLEGVPFEKELVPLPYHTKKFPGLFRDSKIVVWGSSSTVTPQPTTPANNPLYDPKTVSILSGLPTRFPAPARSPGVLLMDSPISTKVIMNNLPRTPSSSTLASDGFPALKPASLSTNSWAAKAAAPPPPISESLVYKPAVREEFIARNRSGQRIDPPCKDYDKVEVDRIKKIKMCNIHFLRNECPYDAQCTHLHACNPTSEELSTLRLVARMAPCQNGSSCQDIKCIYGHRCPAPSHKVVRGKGTKSCIFGEACKFPSELHDIDTNVVKTLVVR